MNTAGSSGRALTTKQLCEGQLEDIISYKTKYDGGIQKEHIYQNKYNWITLLYFRDQNLRLGRKTIHLLEKDRKTKWMNTNEQANDKQKNQS